MITFGDLRSWAAAPLGAAGEGLKSDLDDLEESAEQIRSSTVPGSWSSLSAAIARMRQRTLVNAMESHVTDARRVQTALFETETLVAEIERLVLDIDGRAEAQQFRITAAGAVIDRSPPLRVPPEDAELLRAERQRLADALAHEVTAVLAKAAAADATLAGSGPDGVTTAADRGVLDPDVAEAWVLLSDEERRAIVEMIIRDRAEHYGVDVDEISFEPDPEGGNGFWRESDRMVWINPDRLANPDILHTVPHEVRHAAQHQMYRDLSSLGPLGRALVDAGAIDDPFVGPYGVTIDEVREMKENSDNYLPPRPDPSRGHTHTFQDYLDQPVEADARGDGRDFVETLTLEELEAYRDRVGDP